MRTVCVNFEDHELRLVLFPATSENAVYMSHLEKMAGPHQLALSMDLFSDEAAVLVLAAVYAKTVVAEHDVLDEEACTKWFADHPDEFGQAVHIAENPDRWEELSHGGG